HVPSPQVKPLHPHPRKLGSTCRFGISRLCAQLTFVVVWRQVRRKRTSFSTPDRGTFHPPTGPVDCPQAGHAALYAPKRLYRVFKLMPKTSAARFLSPLNWSSVARMRRRSASASEVPTLRYRFGPDESSVPPSSWGKLLGLISSSARMK